MKMVRMMATILFGCMVAVAHAQGGVGYPSKSIDLYTPFPGYNDAMARLIAQKMSEKLGQTIIVHNLPGAAGAVAALRVRSAPADGYTLLFGSNGMFTINDLFNPKLEYKYNDFIPITQAYSDPTLLLVTPSLPVKNVKELLAYAKANPGKLTYGSSGVGTITHLDGAVLAAMSHTDMVHVPYKGTAQALTDLIGGRISLLFFPPQDAKQYIDIGKVRVLAVSSHDRFAEFPDLPTLDESGLRGYNLVVWYGFFAPAGVPKPVIDKLQQAAAYAIESLNLRTRDLLPGGDTPEQFEALIRQDRQSLHKIIRDTGMKITTQ